MYYIYIYIYICIYMYYIYIYKPLAENAVLPHTETMKLAHPFIFN